jgi:hypothetical protein
MMGQGIRGMMSGAMGGRPMQMSQGSRPMAGSLMGATGSVYPHGMSQSAMPMGGMPQMQEAMAAMGGAQGMMGGGMQRPMPKPMMPMMAPQQMRQTMNRAGVPPVRGMR